MGFSLRSEAQAGCALRRGSREFAARGGLVWTDAARGDVRFEIVFTFDRGAGEAAEHGDLADVIEGVGDGALEEAFNRLVERLAGGEITVEVFYGGKEALDFGVPWQWCGVMPGLLALGDGKRPLKEIAHVSENLRGRARLIADVEAGEMIGSAAQGFATAVGNGGDSVTEELTGRIGCCGHAAIPFSHQSLTLCIIRLVLRSRFRPLILHSCPQIFTGIQ